MPYHVIIRYGLLSGVEFDKDGDWIDRHIATPRRNGDDIFFAGKMFTWSEIEEIHIYYTKEYARELYKGSDDPVAPHFVWHYQNRRAAAVRREAEEVTHQFISGWPGGKQ